MPLSCDPADFGLESEQEPDLPMFGPPEDGRGTGDDTVLASAAADVTRAVLAGEHGPARAATLLTAGLILKAGGRGHSLADSVGLAAEVLDSGRARDVCEKLESLA